MNSENIRFATYFPESLPVRQQQEDFFLPSQIELKPFRQSLLSECEWIFICVPIFIPSKNVFVDSRLVWAKYLAKVYPRIKPVFIGLHRNDEGKNHLDWLSLAPGSLPFLESLATANLLPEPLEAEDGSVSAMWRRFWDGHNRSGLVFPLIDLRNNLEILNFWVKQSWIEEGIWHRSLKILQENLILAQRIKAIWIQHLDYWMATPFELTIKKVGDMLDCLDVEWIEPAILVKIAEILKQLDQIYDLLNYISEYFLSWNENRKILLRSFG